MASVQEYTSEQEIQTANARSLADLRLKENLTNNPIYLISAEDPSGVKGSKYYITLKMLEQNLYIDFFGFEVGIKDKDKINNVTDVEEYLKSNESLKLESIKIPWNKIINVKNKTYKYKGK